MTLICFASPKGGVGKTTLAANVAHELSRSGVRVIALDLVHRTRSACILAFPCRTAGFTQALTELPDWRDYLRQSPSGLALLPYGSSGISDAIDLALAVAETPMLLLRPIDDILAGQDVCLIVDTPPGPSSLLAAVLSRAALLVTVFLVDTASVSLIPAVERDILHGWGEHAPDVGFVLNQFDPRTRLGGVIADAATQHLGERLLGTVYRDENVAEAVAAQRLLADYAPASKASHDIAAISRAILHRLRLNAAGQQTGRRRS